MASSKKMKRVYCTISRQTAEQYIREKQLPLRWYLHPFFSLKQRRAATASRRDVPYFFLLKRRSLVKKAATCARLVFATREWSHDTRTSRGKNIEDSTAKDGRSRYRRR